MVAKKIAAERAVENIREGMTVGLGSGSTAYYMIERIGEKVKQGLKIKTVASSVRSEDLARKFNIPTFPVSAVGGIDIAIDGADEVDEKGNLMKGGGGSLLREKILAFASTLFFVIIDGSKLVDHLGRRPVPVEITPFGAALTLQHLRALGCDPSIRKTEGNNFISDNGNMVVDCKFQTIEDPAWLDMEIKIIPGVVETGLFSKKIVTSIFVGYDNGEVIERYPQGK
ncbi:MAG: ribose-5-phosphate isomerase RpiA [Cyclobacteriaceae bacterium]